MSIQNEIKGKSKVLSIVEAIVHINFLSMQIYMKYDLILKFWCQDWGNMLVFRWGVLDNGNSQKLGDQVSSGAQVKSDAKSYIDQNGGNVYADI